MRENTINKNSQGFAAVEVILIAVIVLAIIGIGYYVIHQKNSANQTLSTSNSSVLSPGTTSGINKLTLQDANTESSVDGGYDGQIQTNISNANNSAAQVGNAYNESNL